MPGASRMYPETDIAPFKISGINVSKPRTLDERKKHTLNNEESKQLVLEN